MADAPSLELPGTTKPRRFRPQFHYELLVCGLRGHELIGLDAARIRPRDGLVVREADGLRWHRCVRCDSWLPFQPPSDAARQFPPNRAEIELPLRGKALRDKVVLRLIAINRAFHFLVLALVSLALFLFASHAIRLRHVFFRLVNAVQGTAGGPATTPAHGFLHELGRLVELRSSTLYVIAAAAAAYAALEGAEAVGLWFQRRWAEHLTFVATSLLLPVEVYELTRSVSPFKLIALVVNLAIVAYLLLAKRLFGLRGGAAADREERGRDSGWQALERLSPEAIQPPDPDGRSELVPPAARR